MQSEGEGEASRVMGGGVYERERGLRGSGTDVKVPRTQTTSQSTSPTTHTPATLTMVATKSED